MKGKILTWDEFRTYCEEDAYAWYDSGWSCEKLTVEEILSEYSDDYFTDSTDDYFTDSTDDDYDELSSCFTPDEFAAKTLEYLRRIENENAE